MHESKNREVVVITGASAGVGRAVARRFAEEGACIGLLARGADGLEGARRDVEERGGKAFVCKTDVAYPEQLEAAANAVEKEFGPIDIWINNAMASIFSPFEKITPEEFKRVTEVTYLGTVYGTMAALKRMLPRNRGAIVQVGSALAYRGIPLQSAYCGAKHAIQGFMDSLRCELLHAKSNVHVCMVQLPGVNTPQFEWVRNRLKNKPRPLGAVFEPEIPAEAIYWAAHHRRPELYVGFPTVEAILGNKITPSIADRLLARFGFAGQQRAHPDNPSRPNNLFEPVPGDFGAHGPFDQEAATHSPQLWLTMHRRGLGIAAAGASVALTIALALKSRQRLVKTV